MQGRNAGQERNAYKNFFTILYTGIILVQLHTTQYKSIYTGTVQLYSCIRRQAERARRALAHGDFPHCTARRTRPGRATQACARVHVFTTSVNT